MLQGDLKPCKIGHASASFAPFLGETSPASPLVPSLAPPSALETPQKPFVNRNSVWVKGLMTGSNIVNYYYRSNQSILC